MFFENEPIRTLTLIEFLLVMLIGLVPVAINIWMKPLLSRRRVAEDERDSLTRADHESRDAGGAGFLRIVSRHSSKFASHESSASFPRHSTGPNHLRPLW